jgi:hypothetical protein
MGPVGELARASPRAYGGGTGDAGKRLCDAAAADARHKFLVVTRWPPRPKYHRGAPRARAGARQCTVGLLQRGPGRASTVAGVSRSRGLAHQCVERGPADPCWSRVADLKVRALVIEFEIFPCCFCARAFSDSAFSRISFTVDRSLRAGLERGITVSIS